MCCKKIILCCGLVFSGALYAGGDTVTKNKDARVSLKRPRDTVNDEQPRKRRKTTDDLPVNTTVVLRVKYPSVSHETNSVGVDFSLHGEMKGFLIIDAVEQALQGKKDLNGKRMSLYADGVQIVRSQYYRASQLKKLEVK